MKPRKCPNCGAPVSGSVCTYCGQAFAEASQPSPVSVPPAEESIQVIRPKRNVFDKILIIIGGLWLLLVIAVAVDLRYYHPVEIVATLLLASPGIVLLMIGFRRKKTAIVKGQHSKK